MITILCMYSNRKEFEFFLKKSILRQNTSYELIEIDGTNHIHCSPARVFNEYAKAVSGDYILFISQSCYFTSDTCLQDIEQELNKLPDVGIAGVFGLREYGATWKDKILIGNGIYNEPPFDTIPPINTAEKACTLDDTFLIIPKKIFDKVKFDEKAFDQNFLFGADYCLSIKKLNFQPYVLPAAVVYTYALAFHHIFRSPMIYNYSTRLYYKFKNDFHRIDTYLGRISALHLLWKRIINFFFRVTFFLPHYYQRIWMREINHSQSILNLGCGRLFQAQLSSETFSVGVDLYEPALLISKENKIHSNYLLGDLRTIEFKPKSFDTIMIIEVLEHLTREEGEQLLKRIEHWAKKRIIITTPNGHCDQEEYDLNPYQIHQSAWQVQDYKNLGYRIRGIGGYKGFRGMLGFVKFRSILIGEIISRLSNEFTYFFPQLDYRLMAIKDMQRENINS